MSASENYFRVRKLSQKRLTLQGENLLFSLESQYPLHHSGNRQSQVYQRSRRYVLWSGPETDIRERHLSRIPDSALS